MRTAAVLLLTAAAEVCAAVYPFALPESGDAVAEIEMSAPGADWAVRGREAAVAVIRVAGQADHHVFVHAAPATYRLFLGRLGAGRHELSIERDAVHSAEGAGLAVRSVRVTAARTGTPEAEALAHAPVVFARRNTVGAFSDVPLMAYCERLIEAGETVLQYTIVFSNEDGGTSTRALMARWGRTTDIEYVARVYPQTGKTIVQGPGHKDVEFHGAHDGLHALLMPTTNNNMIGEASGSPLRFQHAPVLVDLASGSRERVMDGAPHLYEVMTKELAREGKLRPFGAVAGENISDPRNYAYIEYRASHRDSAFAVTVFTTGGQGFSSHLGRIDYAIDRNGWVRTAVELPPGTRPHDIERVAFECVVPPPREKEGKIAHSGQCRLERVGKAFFLDERYRPGASWLRVDEPRTVPTGTAVSFRP